MSWRTVVIRKNAKLDYHLGYIVIRENDTIKIHIDEISVLIIESTGVSLTCPLLSELVKKKVKIVFCDEKRNPSSELIPYYGAHDTSSKIRQQIRWSQETKTTVWTEIVAEKIRQQSQCLHVFNKGKAEQLLKYVEEIELGDKTNREGHAAKVYFNSLFGMEFSRSQENAINAALNYGYSIILSAVNREIAANGYLTQIGLFHDNMFNPFNLGSDLMEPIRPLVDRKVYELEPDKFEHDEKAYVLTLLQDKVIISGKNEVLLNAVKIYVRSVFDALNNSDISEMKFFSL